MIKNDPASPASVLAGGGWRESVERVLNGCIDKEFH